MAEQILRTYNTNSGRSFALTQGNKHVVSHLFYKPKYLDGSVSEYELKSKAYLGDGSILRTGEGYSIVMPKAGTGNFSIIDGEYRIEGRLKKGKLAELRDFYRQGKSTDYRPRMLDINNDITRAAAEKILKQVKEGTQQLHNQTICILKKILKILPK